MGNSQTKEVRGPSPTGQSRDVSGQGQPERPMNSRSGRGSRPELSFLSFGSHANLERQETEYRRDRETRQEREIRKLEKERLAKVAREKERQRSMREEHVDGGYLVTQGVYTGTEDFNAPIVRQLMIERRIAPFWRGLDDFREDWVEHQLVAAARGLRIPAADEIPLEDSEHPTPEASHTPNMQNLTVPINGRSSSYASDNSATLSPSHPAFATSTMASPPTSQSVPLSSSMFRPKSNKTFASLTMSSKNASQEQIVPRELQMPKDPFVNGQALEAFLYKDATECPICFMYYPPYLNKTRCCDQALCSECFVQIKRLDPHPPEHEHHDAANPAPAVPPPEQAETLVSEPATCPYCQQAEFGVTFEPPPIRRGLTYSNLGPSSHLGSAMSSSTSLSSMGSPTTLQPTPPAQRRRTTSVSANASTVITTDKIRPDWASKLAEARNRAARRSAAATALHTAAFVMGGQGSRPPRRPNVEELNEMMMAEAMRRSWAEEENRRRKEEKLAAKEAKKKAKEDKKAEKKASRGVYSSGGSTSGSALSLSLPGVGRRRGNSGPGAFLREATLNSADSVNNVDKGKNVERGRESSPISISPSPATATTVASTNHEAEPASTSQSVPPFVSGNGNLPDRPSHLRQMSNASSPASSFIESIPGSLHIGNDFRGSSSSIDSPNASGTHLGADTPDDGGSGIPGLEPMFNFRSLAAMVKHEDEDEKGSESEHVEHVGHSAGHKRGQSSASAHRTQDELLTQSQNTLKPGVSEAGSGVVDEPNYNSSNHMDMPELTVTPVTPAPGDHDSKQLGQQQDFEVLQNGKASH